MNNNIEEKYCSFEVSKLLHKKGFHTGGNHGYDFYGTEIFNPKINLQNGWYSSPTHQIAMEWLRVNFDIDIIISPDKTFKNTKYYFYEIAKNADPINNTQNLHSEILEMCHQDVSGNYINRDLFEIKIFEMGFAFNTPQEAIEAALLYTLKELI